MVQKVSIRNFKSIKELEVACRKVNVFIGEPNSGKSNILEALALLSEGFPCANVKNLVRYRHVSDLFHDQNIAAPAEVRADSLHCSLTSRQHSADVSIVSDRVQFGRYSLNSDGSHSGGSNAHLKPSVKYYMFDAAAPLNDPRPGFLLPPFGQNLVALLNSNKVLRELVKGLLGEKRLKLQIRVAESELFATKEVDEVLYSYSYPTLSETLRRIVFYMAVLETNQDASLVLDEPESNTFPFYTKYLAERIGLDPTNQFFLSTHNPYLLQSIVQKTPITDLAVFITYMRDYQTRLRQLTDAETASLLDPPTGSVADVFFNLDKFVEE